MSFQRYPEYKDSGVETVGAIPAGWTPTRLRFLLQDGYNGLKIGPFGSQLTSDMLVEGSHYKVYGQENVIANDFIRGSRYIDGDKFQELSVYEILPGDLLITMMGTSGRCDVAPPTLVQGIMDSHLLRMRVTPIVRAEFVRLLIDEAPYVGMQIELAGKGSIMHGLNSTIVKNLLLFVPPDDEQNFILLFLDRETAKIDALVAEQRQLMELLKEKRQAIISHAVTRGLNPHAPMKPSGIEWLGDVPEHWEVLKGALIGTLFGSEQVPEDAVLDEGDLPFIKVGSLSRDSFEIESWDYFVDRSVAANCRPHSGYIVFPKRGAAIFTNKVNIVDRPSLIDPNLMGWQIGERAITAFIAYALKCRKLDELADVSTVPQINNKHISPERFAVPPVDEQHQIVAYLNAESAKFDTLTAETQRAIDLLQERRTALISAAVTGKIDVRQISTSKASA
jgi:type I restriction enzyme S subunit